MLQACVLLYVSILCFVTCYKPVLCYTLQACVLESDSKDTELRRECLMTLTYMAIGQLSAEAIQPLLDVIKQVSGFLPVYNQLVCMPM